MGVKKEIKRRKGNKLERDKVHAKKYEKILKIVNSTLGVNDPESRKRDNVEARMVLVYICRDRYKIPYMTLERLMGKDHASILNNFNKATYALEVYPEFIAKYLACVEVLDRKDSDVEEEVIDSPLNVVEVIDNKIKFWTKKREAIIKNNNLFFKKTYFNKSDKCGFIDLDDDELCRHVGHTPPSHLYIPPGKAYRHICPGCNKETIVKETLSF